MIIMKRNGAEEIFRREKVATAIYKANNSVAEEERLTEEDMERIADRIVEQVRESIHVVGVEDVQNMIENELMSLHAFEVARSFITYRYSRALARKANSTDDQILALLARNNEEVKTENSNKNPIVNSVQRDYMAGEVSKDLCERILVPADVWEAHKDGRIHFHDSDYFAQHMHNCCLVNLEDMLQNGTVISETLITKPNSFQTACNVATQAISQIASNQYGGQSISLAHLAPFVDVSRQKLRKSLREEFENAGISYTDQQLCEVAEERLDSEISAGVQSIQYELITLMTTNGQAPFVTLFMYIDEVPEGTLRDDLVKLIREVLQQRIKGVQNEKGVYITPAFPKLIYVLEEDNIHENSKYYELTRLAAQCTAKRMVPDYISEKVMKEMKGGDVYPCMGCRSFLTPDRCSENVANETNWKQGHNYYGRFNQGVVTINLVDAACSSGGDYEEFWRILAERLELCHKALRVRHERLLGTPSDVAPILWQHGALARLEKGEPIDKLLYGGYSTLSLGYAGLHECVYYMTGKSHTEEVDFAMQVMQALNDACERWREEENIDYSVYGTPLESTTYKFAKCLQKRFGIIKGVTDKNYITNSYHVHVTEKISAFDKLSFEAPFQKLSPGGAISYIEVPNMQNNIEAILSIMQYMYDNIMYAEINTKSDYCQVCGYDGEIRIVEDEHDKLVWECPNCGNRDQQKMNVARRTCGYIGTQFWNQGRTQEIKERVLHI
jgi:ribonucleoside-triphosphate reductase